LVNKTKIYKYFEETLKVAYLGSSKISGGRQRND